MTPFRASSSVRAAVPAARALRRRHCPGLGVRGQALLALALAHGCARFGFEDLGLSGRDAGLGGTLVNTGGGTPDGDAGTGTPQVGAGLDASSSPVGNSGPDAARPVAATCTFGAPQVLGSPNYPGNNLWSPSLASDGQNLFFAVLVPGWVEQVAVATRPDRNSPFGDGQVLPAPVNTDTEGTPNISADGLSLYFFSERAGGPGGRDLYVATRASTGGEFDTVRELSGLNTPDREHLPRVSADELTLYFVSNRGGDTEIWRSTRASRAADFGNPELVPELNSADEDGAVTVSPDGLEAILSSNRPGGVGARDLYRATRRSTSEPFSAPELLTELSSGVNDYDPTLSFDGTELYFVSNRNGSDTEVFRALRTCP